MKYTLNSIHSIWFGIELLVAIFFHLPQTNAQGNFFDIQGIVGTKLQIHENQLPQYPTAFQVVSKPLLGLKISCRTLPVSVLYTYDVSFAIYNRKDNPNGISNLAQKTSGNLVLGIYERKKSFFELGHYWQKHESFTGFAFGLDKRSNFIVTGFGLKFGQTDIDFQRRIMYKPLFAVFVPGYNSINIRYHIGRRRDDGHNFYPKSLKLNLLIGFRLFPIHQDPQPGEDFSLLGTSLHLGAELLITKLNVSINLERDWWLALNGGSYTREIKGYVSNTILGVRYHLPLHDEKTMKFGLGAAFITDNNTLYETRININPGPYSVRLWYYNVKGISLSVSYPITKQFDVEARQIISYAGEKGYNPMRSSVGVIYRIRTDK
jgi:hypothetical protein